MMDIVIDPLSEDPQWSDAKVSDVMGLLVPLKGIEEFLNSRFGESTLSHRIGPFGVREIVDDWESGLSSAVTQYVRTPGIWVVFVTVGEDLKIYFYLREISIQLVPTLASEANPLGFLVVSRDGWSLMRPVLYGPLDIGGRESSEGLWLEDL